MSQHQSQEFCKACGRHTMHFQPVIPINHTAHLVVSVVSLGFWVPFWMLDALGHKRFPGPIRCTMCGQETPVEQPDMLGKAIRSFAGENATVHNALRVMLVVAVLLGALLIGFAVSRLAMT